MKHGLCLLLILLMGCASLTPERINVLAQIAGQAAQLGAQEWLAKHPEHRAAFDAVIVAISALVRNGNTNILAYTELLSSLPTDTLRGVDGELYLSDTLIVYDKELRKSTRIVGAAEKPVMDAVRVGLRRAVGPVPPMPPSRSWPQQPPILSVVPEGAPTNRVYVTPPHSSHWYGPSWTNYTNAYFTPPGISTNEMTDAQLDAEFLRIKAQLEKRKGK